ncbi:hypothetical protein [Enterococcus faecalis]|uniref:hypothetical protein n=1 Tax=Enterococcus faecalis TaxID=1351 RepID=UPI00045AB252|nr:hypothetical protein [Enterococcus faecalis]KAJ85599.1 hypothetical protein P791_1198 [Enterococcus faecalis NY9]
MPIDQSDKILKELLTKEGCWPFFIKRIENEGCLMAVPVNSVQRTNGHRSVPVWSIRTPFPSDLEGTE